MTIYLWFYILALDDIRFEDKLIKKLESRSVLFTASSCLTYPVDPTLDENSSRHMTDF
jgi:hypothetical protein